MQVTLAMNAPYDPVTVKCYRTDSPYVVTHRALDAAGKPVTSRSFAWRATHLPSGRSMYAGDSRGEARAYADRLHALGASALLADECPTMDETLRDAHEQAKTAARRFAGVEGSY